MVIIIDYDSYNFFNEIKIINNISYSFSEVNNEVFELRYNILNKDDKVFFNINPSVDFISLLFKDNELNINVDVSNMPNLWMGELIVDEKGIIKKIPLYFEKNKFI